MKKNVLLLWLLTFSMSFWGQQVINKDYVSIRFVPDKVDWTYKMGETPQLQVSVERGQKPISNVELSYSVGKEMMEPMYTKKITLKEGTCVLTLPTLKEPGFLMCKASVKIDGRTYTNWINLGFSPEQIEPVVAEPEDFLSFWNKQMDYSKTIALNPQLTLLPERCTSKVNVYEVRYDNVRVGSSFYGILCIPKQEGKYPAILYVPGAGVRPYSGQIAMAEQGFITLEVGIHGIPVTYPQFLYDNLKNGALLGYQAYHVDNRESYYYKNVYLGCLRGVDVLASLPQFDGENLATYGGSQGGALSVVIASLDKRVKCAVSFYPALSDQLGYLHKRAGGWPHLFKNKSHCTDAKIETVKYYDVVNFARHLQCPVFFSWGYNDQTCPPTSTYAVFNSVRSEKQLFLVQETAHWTFPEQHDKAKMFVIEKLTQRNSK